MTGPALRREAHNPIRVLLCKSGLEEHNQGVRYVARKLVEDGMEVVYIVFHRPEEAAIIAIDEDVDVVGLSSSAGGHITVVKTIREELDSRGGTEVPLIVGGIIPEQDREPLREIGVIAAFGPGSAPQEIAQAIRSVVAGRSRRTRPGKERLSG